MIHIYSLRDFFTLINFYIIHVILMWIFVNQVFWKFYNEFKILTKHYCITRKSKRTIQ